MGVVCENIVLIFFFFYRKKTREEGGWEIRGENEADKELVMSSPCFPTFI